MSQINQNQITNPQNQQFSQNQMQHISNRNFPQIQYNQNEQQQNKQNYKEEDIINQINEIRNFIDNNNINEFLKFININQPSRQALQSCLSYLLDNYHQKSHFYKFLEIFIYVGIDIYEFFLFNNQKFSLLMLGFFFNDIEFIKVILKFIKDINHYDNNNKNAIIYCVLYNMNDNPEIINLLIKDKANVDSETKIEINKIYELHSVFTLSCLKGLTNIVRVLLENKVNVNFQTYPKGDTGLHLAVQNKDFEIVDYF